MMGGVGRIFFPSSALAPDLFALPAVAGVVLGLARIELVVADAKGIGAG